MRTDFLFRFIGFLLAIVILGGIVMVTYKYTNGFSENFKTFYIEYDGKQIVSEKSKMTLNRGESHTFKVKYLFNNGAEQSAGYSVRVIPNLDVEESDFDFKVGEETYSYLGVKELTKAFNIKKEANSFTITIPENATILSILQKLYSDKEVLFEGEEVSSQASIFKLEISSYNEKVTYQIDFSFLVLVTGVTFGNEVVEI